MADEANTPEGVISPAGSDVLKARLHTASRAVFATVILGLLAYIIDWRTVLEILGGARLELMALAAGLLVLGNFLIAWRWQLLLHPLDVQTTVSQALQSYLKGHFVAHFLPSGIAADVIKAVDMHGAQEPGQRKVGMELASSIFVERTFGAITVAVAVMLGLALSPISGQQESLGGTMLLTAMAVLACCALALFADKLLAVVPISQFRRIPRTLLGLIRRGRDSFVTYRSLPGRLVGVMLLSIVIQALRILPVFFIGLALGAQAGFFAYLIAVPIIFLSAMVPFVGSRVGTEQGLFVLLLGLAGVVPELAMAIALLSLAVSLLVSLPGGYWLLKGRSRLRRPPSIPNPGSSSSSGEMRGWKRWPLGAAVATVAVISMFGTAIFAPGLFRLVIIQPTKDLLYLLREVQPFSQRYAVERHRPVPAQTLRLPADESVPHDIDIELDLWLPESLPAPAVLLLHGSSPRGRQLGFNKLLAESLRDAGWLVLTPDARGFGGSGHPENPDEPQAWQVQRDLLRLVAYARAHPAGDGSVFVVGHSLGGSQIVQAGIEALDVQGVALIGPSRRLNDRPPSWLELARFSGDRRMARPPPIEMLSEMFRQQDILEQASRHGNMNPSTPVLLMDGKLEGEALIGILEEAARRKGELVQHVTVEGSHHYCGAYQPPWPARTVFVRPEVFAACFEVLEDFLESVHGSPGGRS